MTGDRVYRQSIRYPVATYVLVGVGMFILNFSFSVLAKREAVSRSALNASILGMMTCIMMFVGSRIRLERIVLSETGIVYKKWFVKKWMDWDGLEDVVIWGKDMTISFLSRGKVKLVISSLKCFENYEDLVDQLKSKLGDKLRISKE